ncbi:hypothetical protein [Lentzea sp. NPDC051838]|uniref:hypothetical protein n=1 Tax=Lentzea sp. NPDC051838 TaxID=3154849 RepID=UPI00343CE32F
MTDVPLTRSVRLIFEFAAEGVRLLEQHPVNVTVGLFRDSDAGDYVEVRNREGRTVSRVPVWAGLGSNVETFPQDPDTGSDTPRVLTVVVPAPPDADHVAIVRDTRNTRGGPGTPNLEVLGTFRLSR